MYSNIPSGIHRFTLVVSLFLSTFMCPPSLSASEQLPYHREKTYAITSTQIQRLGESIGVIAGSQVSSGYFGLLATVKGYESGELSKKYALALVKQFHTDAENTLSELLSIPTTLGEPGQRLNPPLEDCLRSLIKQTDFFMSYVTAGNDLALEKYWSEYKTFTTLLNKLLTNRE